MEQVMLSQPGNRHRGMSLLCQPDCAAPPLTFSLAQPCADMFMDSCQGKKASYCAIAAFPGDSQGVAVPMGSGRPAAFQWHLSGCDGLARCVGQARSILSVGGATAHLRSQDRPAGRSWPACAFAQPVSIGRKRITGASWPRKDRDWLRQARALLSTPTERTQGKRGRGPALGWLTCWSGPV